MNYESTVTHDSKITQGVRFTICRMSFGRRIELTKQIRELGGKVEFLEAGEKLGEKVEAALLGHQIERLYLEWGLRAIGGLQIDGQDATPAVLAEAGPEDLCKEIVEAIKVECGFSEDERKN